MQSIQPGSMPVPTSPFSPGMRAGDFLFVSGQTATNADHELWCGDFPKEVESALDNVETVLAAGGATMADVCKVNVFLGNALHFGPFNEIYRRRFGTGALPARSTVVLDFGHPDVRVEVEVIAYLGGSDA